MKSSPLLALVAVGALVIGVARRPTSSGGKPIEVPRFQNPTVSTRPGPSEPLGVETLLAGPRNLAFHKPVRATAYDPALGPDRLTDGDSTSFYYAHGGTLDAVVDLLDPQEVRSIVLVWGYFGCSSLPPGDRCNNGRNGYAQDVTLSGSPDGSTWSELDHRLGPQHAPYTLVRLEKPQRLRYLRVQVPLSIWWTGLYELAAFGAEAPAQSEWNELRLLPYLPATTPVPFPKRAPGERNLAANRPVLEHNCTGDSAARLTDGDIAAEGCYPRGKEAHATVDLGAVRKLSTVEIGWNYFGCSPHPPADVCNIDHHYVDDFGVELSEDGVTFAPLAHGGIPGWLFTDIAVPPEFRRARFVRVHASSQENWVLINELAAFGTD